ncbi:hypothetical protein [Cryptosporangium aurantiacum]|uniref:Uncharacterized protein n=1 Tax=Cryptosporangium aurantiacum TaxID=134849 RepID=A0A1M7RMB6_9ACTN|nr:hypothetical protein [Cryptosporangium aurantiacum]SHN47236.1 hypothetical protein SAMN05443668_12184 [Cryptosporangium aurantiacum]
MRSVPDSPVDRILTASLVVAPLLLLLTDVLYALRGWDDSGAAIVHVLGSAAFLLVLLRVLTVTGGGAFGAALLIVGVLGGAGNIGYGFNSIHVSLGDTDLNDASGAAALIKVLGLCFPLTLLLIGLAYRRSQAPWIVALLVLAAVVWPIAHIANLGWLAVLGNVLIVVPLAAIAAPTRARVLEPAAVD